MTESELDYYTFEDVPPRGDAGYRLVTYEYDQGNVVSTSPNQHVFFALSDQKTLDKQNTRFTNYRYNLSGVNIDGLIKLNDVEELDETTGNVTDDRLLFLTFHVVDIGTSPNNTVVESVREQFVPGSSDMFEFNNNVSRDFPIENILNDHYYYIFFNVYTMQNDQSSIIYSSIEDYATTGYNPIKLTRVVLTSTNANIDSFFAMVKIQDIHTMESNTDSVVYKISMTATPI